VLAVVVVLAGCAAPASPPESPPAAEGDRSAGDRGIRLNGGDLPADPNRTFARVQELMGTDVEPPDEVRVESSPPSRDGEFGAPSGFWVVLGVEPATAVDGARNGTEGGITRSQGITIYTGSNDTETLRLVLVHEFVHAVQFRNGRFDQLARNVSRLTVDGRYVHRAILEGVAVYVTDAYADRYPDVDGNNSRLLDRRVRGLSPGSLDRYSLSRYVVGARYVDLRVDGPDATAELYANPPNTSEQLIHGYAPGAEPPRPIDVRVDGTDDGWGTARADRMGEAWIRTALRNGLNATAAHAAAAGWGNDELLTLSNGPNRSYVWAIRFDDAGNATEFEGAFRRYLDARGTRSNGTWTVANRTVDVRPVAPETVVVLVGNDSLVESASVGGSAATVAVDLNRSREAVSSGPAPAREPSAVPTTGPRRPRRVPRR